MINKQAIMRHMTLFLVLLLIAVPLLSPIRASAKEEDIDFFTQRYSGAASLPFSDSHTFFHSGKAEENADGHNISFYAEAGRIVSLYFGRGEYVPSADTQQDDASSKAPLYSAVSAEIYSDQGKEICSSLCGKDSARVHLSFMPSYSGIYYLSLVSRSAEAGEYLCDFSLSQTSSIKLNAISTYPHNKGYSKNTHKTSSITSLFDKDYYLNTGYVVSVFEIKHEAASIFSYNVTSPDASASPYCILYRYDGDSYSTHSSRAYDTYDAGGAYEMCYNGTSYLLVFSHGAFDLSTDMLKHSTYPTSAISIPFRGMLDTSDSVLLYESESFDALIKKYPFSDIKNRYVKFFELTAEKNSIVTFYYDRRNHSNFSVVSDEMGLSHGSEYPARLFGEYCSESMPTELCYSSYISDSGRLYLCYTGTDQGAYVEIKSDAACTLSTEYKESYLPNDALPSAGIGNIYSDLSFFTDSGIVDSISTVNKISGYVFIDEKNARVYQSADTALLAPQKNGAYTLYVVIDCTYTFPDPSKQAIHKYYSLCLGQIKVKSAFSLPGIITDIGNAVGIDSPVLSFILFGVILLTAVLAAGYIFLSLKKKKAAKGSAASRPPIKEEPPKSPHSTAQKLRKRPIGRIGSSDNSKKDTDGRHGGEGE